MIHHGDCVEVMAELPENSVDAIVCDPPYGLEFMGKEWDRIAAIPERDDRWSTNWGGYGWHGGGRTNPVQMQEWHHRWATAALRVAKPGAYLLAFGGTRTSHRLACAIEDAGWIIRDTLVWAYASGFPKGRANLKPAWEPIVMARKPGPLRPLAIDECRIAHSGEPVIIRRDMDSPLGMYSPPRLENEIASAKPEGRWPANLILTDPIFDGDVDGVVGGGEQSGGGYPATRFDDQRSGTAYGKGWAGGETGREPFDTTGTYSRFFLIPKAARSDREPNDYGKLVGGLEEKIGKIGNHGNLSAGDDLSIKLGSNSPRANVHPTVKPTELMRHLVRLVTPVGGVVLDPFLGSGTTAIAAEMEGFDWIGIEKEAEYVKIAEARLAGVQKGLGLTA